MSQEGTHQGADHTSRGRQTEDREVKSEICIVNCHYRKRGDCCNQEILNNDSHLLQGNRKQQLARIQLHKIDLLQSKRKGRSLWRESSNQSRERKRNHKIRRLTHKYMKRRFQRSREYCSIIAEIKEKTSEIQVNHDNTLYKAEIYFKKKEDRTTHGHIWYGHVHSIKETLILDWIKFLWVFLIDLTATLQKSI